MVPVLYPDIDTNYVAECLPNTSVEEKFTALEELPGFSKHYPRQSDLTIEGRNQVLLTLLDAFPTAQADFVRNLVAKQSSDIRNQAALALLSQPYPHRPYRQTPTRRQLFKTKAYREQVKVKLYNEFPSLWKNQIKAVLSEVDSDYGAARAILLDIAKRPVSTFVRVLGFLVGDRSQRPLPRQLNEDLVADLQALSQQRLQAQVSSDHSYALELNSKQYEEEGQGIECSLCTDTKPFEQTITCRSGHPYCHQCVHWQLTERILPKAMAGDEISPLTCFGSPPPEDAPCTLLIDPNLLPGALTRQVWGQYSNALATQELKRAGLKVAACPACGHLDVPESMAPSFIKKLFKSVRATFREFEQRFAFAFICLAMFGTHVPLLVVCAVLIAHIGKKVVDPSTTPAKTSLTCSNQGCGMVYCYACRLPYHGVAACGSEATFEGTADGLRKYVEEAMTKAQVRICPRCSTPFQKDAGCNKMTCQCGFRMCYLCRSDINESQYDHFCQHFRPFGGACLECNKCELFYDQSTGAQAEQIRRVGQAARDEYVNMFPALAADAGKMTTVGGVRL